MTTCLSFYWCIMMGGIRKSMVDNKQIVFISIRIWKISVKPHPFTPGTATARPQVLSVDV